MNKVMTKRLSSLYWPVAFDIVLLAFITCSAQTPKALQPYPDFLPYTFSNFVWWSDGELRSLVKSRVAGLSEEIPPRSPIEHKLRNALTEALKEKGIIAEVQSTEPSGSALTGERAPGAPPPSIVFSILSPQILVDKVTVSGAPDAVATSLREASAKRRSRILCWPRLVGSIRC